MTYGIGPSSIHIRIAIGVLLLLPLGTLAIAFAFVFAAPDLNSAWLAEVFFVSFPIFIALVFYFVYLVATSALPDAHKVIWAMSLLLYGPLAAPVFWYVYMWRSPKRVDTPRARAST